MIVCKNCALYNGDCGHHFVDQYSHKHYDTPSDTACDKYGDCSFYKESRTALEIALEELEQSKDISPSSKRVIEARLSEVKAK